VSFIVVVYDVKIYMLIEIGLPLCLILGSPHSLLHIRYAANADGSIKRIKIQHSVDVIIRVNLNVGETLLEIIIQLSE